MNLFFRCFKDLKKYKEYIFYGTKLELKKQVESTILGYFWWILDPFLHMIIYTILVSFIFKKNQENFPIFVFCGLLPWKWASSSFSSSVNVIKSKEGILNQVYIPKVILGASLVLVNFIKFLFGLVVLFLLLLLFKIKINIFMLQILPITIIYGLLIFSGVLILSNLGVFVKDLKNFVPHFLRLFFYFSPGMYSIKNIPEKYRIIWYLNPNTVFFESYREALLYGEIINYKAIIIWGLISGILIYLGLKSIYTNDKIYSKIG